MSNFNELREKMPPESRKRASERAEELKRGGCGKPGHVTAGSDEGTQWCATCASEAISDVRGSIEPNVLIKTFNERQIGFEEGLEAAAQECEAQTGHTGLTRKWFAARIRALKGATS